MIPSVDDKLAGILSGRSEEHLCLEPESGYMMHRELIEPFAALRTAARDAGFDLAVASSFRSFERQCLIWNEKAQGRRPVLDDAGEELDISGWSERDKVMAILRWSALPGASRHHWGTDLDIYDRSALEQGQQLQLTIAECEQGGPFHAFHQWLDDYLPGSGFFRPYAIDRGGVGCEPWHISYEPLASRYEAALTPDFLRWLIARFPFALSDTVLEHLDEIYPRFIARS